MINNKLKKICTIVFFSLIVCLIFSLISYKKLTYNYFYKGIFIDGVSVSGLTRQQALKEVRYEFDRNYCAKTITLVYNDKTWKIPLESIDYQYDFSSAINHAYSIGRKGSRLNRLITIRSLENSPVNLIVQEKYDKNKLIDKLTIIKKEIDFSGKSSTYNYNYGKIVYTGDVLGKNLDIETNTKLIEAHLLNRDFSSIVLIIEDIRPPISLSEVKDLKDVLASFSTQFNKNNNSRAHNIELACKKLNNYLLKPGEEFSMNYALGPRTSQNGYMQAPIILKNSMVSGTGGGICQVASTLYNAVLISMLQVTQRVNHSVPIGYVPPGQDATISEGYIDLKFKNNRDYTICIVSEVKDNMVNVKVVGRKNENDPSSVILKPIIEAEYEPPEPGYVIDNNLPDNKKVITIKEKKGFKVVLYRETYNKYGNLLNRERISEDIYKPIRGEYAVNKKTLEIIKLTN